MKYYTVDYVLYTKKVTVNPVFDIERWGRECTVGGAAPSTAALCGVIVWSVPYHAAFTSILVSTRYSFSAEWTEGRPRAGIESGALAWQSSASTLYTTTIHY